VKLSKVAVDPISLSAVAALLAKIGTPVASMLGIKSVSPALVGAGMLGLGAPLVGAAAKGTAHSLGRAAGSLVVGTAKAPVSLAKLILKRARRT
jgi:hypothetical protein